LPINLALLSIYANKYEGATYLDKGGFDFIMLPKIFSFKIGVGYSIPYSKAIDKK
jgi:hypothetical protein